MYLESDDAARFSMKVDFPLPRQSDDRRRYSRIEGQRESSLAGVKRLSGTDQTSR